MLRLLLQYEDQEARVLSLTQFDSIEQLKCRLLSSRPIQLQTTEGIVDIGNPVSAKIQNVYANKVTQTVDLVLKEDGIMADEAALQETVQSNEAPAAVGEQAQGESPQAVLVDVPQGASQVFIQETKQIMDDENKFNQKFQSFREKWLGSEANQESWENQIVEKMIRREAVLKEIVDTLDKENAYLEEFKKDKLGI